MPSEAMVSSKVSRVMSCDAMPPPTDLASPEFLELRSAQVTD